MSFWGYLRFFLVVVLFILGFYNGGCEIIEDGNGKFNLRKISGS